MQKKNNKKEVSIVRSPASSDAGYSYDYFPIHRKKV